MAHLLPGLRVVTVEHAVAAPLANWPTSAPG
jgi:hypothetical protein